MAIVSVPMGLTRGKSTDEGKVRMLVEEYQSGLTLNRPQGCVQEPPRDAT
jgi:hypothetical protein